MKHRPLRVAAIALAALLIASALAVGLSHMIWRRSLPATVYEWTLWRRFSNDRTPDEERARLMRRLDASETPAAIPQGLGLRADIARDQHGDLPYFTLNPNADAGLTILYLHGGAYINGFSRYHWRLMDHLARGTGAKVVAPDYHLVPFGDCERALDGLTALYRERLSPADGERLILMGDSAGGGLALALAQALVREGLPEPERLILISPWVDVTMENPDIAALVPVEPILHLDLVIVHGRMWAGALDPHDPRVSPLFGDMAGLPPVTLFTGTRELLYPDLCLLNEALIRAGVPVDFHVGTGLNHEYPLMPLPEARRAVRQIESRIKMP